MGRAPVFIPNLKVASRARSRRRSCRNPGNGSWLEVKRRFDPAEPELMDRPQPVTPELTSDLRNLRELNRYFGSYRLVEYFLRRWLTPGSRLRIADLATGSGDIPRLIVDYARRINAAVTI